jgi:cyclase
MGKPGIVREAGGPQGAQVNIYAQDNALTRLSAPEAHMAEQGLPTLTFEQLKDFTFNGEGVQIFSEAPAHTDGDSIVFFRGSNVISAGEIFSTVGYPVIDLARGGSIQGEVKALNHLLELTVPEIAEEGGTMVIPGHGHLCDEADVTEYRDMVTIVRDRVADLIAHGKSLDEAKAARVTRDYDGRYSQPTWTGDMFVESIYKSLKQAGNQGSRQ